MGDTLSRAETDFLGTAGGRLPKAADLIIINLGVNDAGDLSTYKRDMRALVEKIMSTQSKTDVVLMTPTSSGSNRLQDFSAAMKELAKEKGLAVIDLNSEWQKYYTAGEYNNGFGKYMSDNWHPSTLGHKVIAAKILGDLIGE
jgi:lysophospholipase L1-like esterase